MTVSRNDRSGASPLNADSAHGRADKEPDRRSDVGPYSRRAGSRAEHETAREKFGGANVGASFFGWIVAVGVAIILTSIIGAVGAAVGFTGSVSQSEAERRAGTIGIAAAVVLLLVLMVGYYCGGYVAGRMSRFDGGRQGLAVWLIGLAVTVIAIGLGALFGSQYNVLDRVSLPRVPIAVDQLGWGAVVTGAAVIVLTLLAAIIGGKVGHRYHDRVDRVDRVTSR
jgi:hypothetical protein